MKVQPFYLLRKEDVNKTAGSGIVAIGVVLSSGRVVMEWLSFTKSLVIFENLTNLKEVHGHGGKTEVKMGDPPEYLLGKSLTTVNKTGKRKIPKTKK